MKNVFTIDVEDWFHILELSSTPSVARWSTLENRVARNLGLLLDVFDSKNVKTTCFFLGWVAEKYPALVKDTCSRGHEIACHSYAHQLVYTQTPKQFAADIKRSKEILEDIAGQEVSGYRAPGFSITADTRWAFDELCSAGFKYDTSIFPARHGHGGIENAPKEPHTVATANGTIMEFPVSVANIGPLRLCFFGGGYLRLFPLPVIQYMAKRVRNEGRPVIYYIHPREVDPAHPRLPMNRWRYFKSYVNLNSTINKIERLVVTCDFVPFRDLLPLSSHRTVN